MIIRIFENRKRWEATGKDDRGECPFTTPFIYNGRSVYLLHQGNRLTAPFVRIYWAANFEHDAVYLNIEEDGTYELMDEKIIRIGAAE